MVDRLLSLLCIFPFRCQLCARRFRRFQWPPHYEPDVVDQRQYEHAAIRFPVRFSGEGTSGEGLLTDIALGGCALETDVKFVHGMLLVLRLQLSAREPPVMIDDAVVRSVRSSSIGLEFVRLKPEEKNRLSLFLARMVGVPFSTHQTIAQEPGSAQARGTPEL